MWGKGPVKEIRKFYYGDAKIDCCLCVCGCRRKDAHKRKLTHPCCPHYYFSFIIVLSGGPLLAPTGEIVGITSFNADSSCGLYFSGYTRVSSYDAWIQETICGLSENPPEGCVLPPDWPAVSPWTPPCGRQDCFGGLAVSMHWELDIFGLFDLCLPFCLSPWFAEQFYSVGWGCGECPAD